jgi:hypothetical protein
MDIKINMMEEKELEILRSNLIKVYAMTLLEYEDMNLLSGSPKKRNLQKAELLAASLQLIQSHL